MPIVKVQEAATISRTPTSDASSRYQAPALDPIINGGNPFVKLRSTGLLQERLRLDAGDKDSVSTSQEASGGTTPDANVSSKDPPKYAVSSTAPNTNQVRARLLARQRPSSMAEATLEEDMTGGSILQQQISKLAPVGPVKSKLVIPEKFVERPVLNKVSAAAVSKSQTEPDNNDVAITTQHHSRKKSNSFSGKSATDNVLGKVELFSRLSRQSSHSMDNIDKASSRNALEKLSLKDNIKRDVTPLKKSASSLADYTKSGFSGSRDSLRNIAALQIVKKSASQLSFTEAASKSSDPLNNSSNSNKITKSRESLLSAKSIPAAATRSGESLIAAISKSASRHSLKGALPTSGSRESLKTVLPKSASQDSLTSDVPKSSSRDSLNKSAKAPVVESSPAFRRSQQALLLENNSLEASARLSNASDRLRENSISTDGPSRAASPAVEAKRPSNMLSSSSAGKLNFSASSASTKYEFQSMHDAESEERDVLNDLKEILHSQSSLLGSDTKRPTIVKATHGNMDPLPGELKFEEGDVLLIIDSTSTPGFYMAKHEITGDTGLINPLFVQEEISLFAEVMALTERTRAGMETPSGKDIRVRASSSNSKIMDYWTSEIPDSSPSLKEKYPHLRELAKASRFNESVENEINSGRKRSRSPTMEESWSSRVGIDVTKIIDKEEKKRQEAIYEYIETERSFVDDMEMVIDGYMRPLREQRLLTESEVVEIFSNLTQILAISTDISSALSQRQLSMNGIMDNIADVLLRELPKLRDFAPFCANLSRAIQQIQEKKRASPPFAEKLSELQRNPYFGNMDLNSYMLKPMQRITKIPLLVKGILKHTSSSQADHQQLTQAEAISQEILLFINTKCGEADEQRKLEKIQGKLNFDLMQDLGLDFLASKRRRILHGGAVECNDKKGFAYLFDDCIIVANTKTFNKSERYQLLKPQMSLWLVEIGFGGSGSVKRPTKMFGGVRTIKEPNKTFTIMDPMADAVYDIVVASSRERESWAAAIEAAQKNLENNARFTAERLKPMPLALNAKTKKMQTFEYNSAMKIDRYIVFSHNEGLVATASDESSTELADCPGFSSKIGQVSVDESIDHLILSESKNNNIEAYPIDNLKHLLSYMFESGGKGSPPGMKVSKLPNSKNTLFFSSGILDSAPHVACVMAKSLVVYQYNRTGKFYKKAFEVAVDGSNCNFVTIANSTIMVGVLNKFFLVKVNGEFGSLEEICDPSLGTQVENSVALDGFLFADDKAILCYNNLGILVDLTENPVKVEKYFLWRSLSQGFGLSFPYIISYGRSLLEIWNANTGQPRQQIYLPGLLPIDKAHHLFSSDVDSVSTLSYLKSKK